MAVRYGYGKNVLNRLFLSLWLNTWSDEEARFLICRIMRKYCSKKDYRYTIPHMRRGRLEENVCEEAILLIDSQYKKTLNAQRKLDIS